MIPDGRLECKIHRRFAADRVQGEWFTLTDELAEFITAAAEPFQRPERTQENRPSYECDGAKLAGPLPTSLPEFDIVDPPPGRVPDDAIEAVAGLILDVLDRQDAEAAEAQREKRPDAK